MDKSRKLRNKKTGELGYLLAAKGLERYDIVDDDYRLLARYDFLVEVAKDWEDYNPVEPIFDEKIRRGIRAWWDMQDNPFKAASVLCYKDKDLDGFYHWRIFGYIRDGEQKESTDLCFRTKKLYDYKPYHDYTKEELCGEEEECEN